MKSIYRVEAYEVFSSMRDRSVFPHVDLCDEIADRLEKGGIAMAHGFKLKPIKGGKFRVYDLR